MKRKPRKPALEVFEEAMNNIMPVLEVKARRIGGATYQVPIEVRPDQTSGVSTSLADHCTLVTEERRQWKKDLRMRLWMQQTILVHLLRKKKICTKWQRQTRLSHTTDSKRIQNIPRCFSFRITDRIQNVSAKLF